MSCVAFLSAATPPLGVAERICSVYALAFAQCTHDLRTTREFCPERMRMSHVCQPVMLLALLRDGGRCSIEEIAQSVFLHYENQVE